jgi:hypothetical protein
VFKLVHLTVNAELITTTADHPFYVKDIGFVNAEELAVGSVVVNSNGETCAVEHVYHEVLASHVKVYNFQVEDFHTYHVGHLGVLVHNATYKNGARMTSDEALDAASDFLGKSYTDKGNGRYVSADGTRQVRIGDTDILGEHGGGPHINFETLEANPTRPGKMRIVDNAHIYLTD